MSVRVLTRKLNPKQIQTGTAVWTAQLNNEVVFPIPFDNIPTVSLAATGGSMAVPHTGGIGSTLFYGRIFSGGSTLVGGTVRWVAIDPLYEEISG